VRKRGSAKGRRLPKALPRQDWQRIIDTAGEIAPALALRNRALVATLFGAGLRCAELCALRISDVDWDKGRLWVRHGKGDKERVPACAGWALELLEAYLDTRAELDDAAPLFLSRKGGPLDTSAVRRLFGAIEERTGLKIHPHACRHSHITEVVHQAEQQGMSIFEVAEQAGHADLDTTRLYYAANSEKRKKLVDGL
jgi:integrase